MNPILTFDLLLEIHGEQLARYGGADGVIDEGRIRSALSQPLLTFDGLELYPTLAEKAAALGYFLICNHGFRDGNKRTGFAAMDVYFMMHGLKVLSSIDDMERAALAVADHQWTRDAFTLWVAEHLVPRDTPPL